MVRPNVSGETCLRCKGSRLLCGKSQCPILIKQQNIIPLKKIEFGTELHGSSPPSIFVGHNFYPNVLVGPMIPPKLGQDLEIRTLDEPDTWYGKSINELIGLRTSLVRTAFRSNVKNLSSKLLDLSQEIIMGSRPVDTEVNLEKAPSIKVLYDPHSPPLGPTAKLNKLRITSDPKIDPKVDKVVDDSDLKSIKALNYLYQNDFSVTNLTRLLSAGLLGVKKDRKLVPTRWSITAVDDSISKNIIKEIKYYQEISKFFFFQNKYLDNNFVIILIPREWSFENMETWFSQSAFNPSSEQIIMQDHEFYEGRKKYASNVTGAYYAARLGVSEYLKKIRKQSACIILREVSGGYLAPLGVWVIRETVRKAFEKEPKKFESLNEVLKEASKYLKTPIRTWLRKSKLLRYIRIQKRLVDYFKHLD
ncbi:MAG: Nre family DNA repair protein [Candidatus Helarchaeota archaeon]